MPVRTVKVLNMDMVAGGIWKEGDRCLSMLRACWMVKLERWECEATCNMADAHIGSILRMVFTSSTLWTVASLHRFGWFGCFMSESLTIAARSNHLHVTKHVLKYDERISSHLKISTTICILQKYAKSNSFHVFESF